ncbi:MAG TPA: dihydrofolate reductase family protein [Anaerolineales bacterium]|nr:dihydrofolate reductase family protein [Anaerolineales bacterium]
MGKLIAFDMVTLDGFFAGPNGEIDWHRVDAEFNEFAVAQLNSVETLVFGRITYQMMAGYWPSPEAVKDDPVVAGLMNSKPKIVVSRTLHQADWNNTRLIGKNVDEELARLKQQPRQDLILMGSGNLAATLANMNLIDEIRLIVVPVVLGRGRGLFEGVDGPRELRLVNTRTFGNGNVLLTYRSTGMRKEA